MPKNMANCLERFGVSCHQHRPFGSFWKGIERSGTAQSHSNADLTAAAEAAWFTSRLHATWTTLSQHSLEKASKPQRHKSALESHETAQGTLLDVRRGASTDGQVTTNCLPKSPLSAPELSEEPSSMPCRGAIDSLPCATGSPRPTWRRSSSPTPRHVLSCSEVASGGDEVLWPHPGRPIGAGVGSSVRPRGR